MSKWLSAVLICIISIIIVFSSTQTFAQEEDIEYSWGTVKSISSSVSRWFGGKTKPSEIQQYHIEKFLNGKLGKVRR